MTSTVTQLQPRGSHHAELPHLPAIARNPTDDAREALAAFAAWQAGQSDLDRADLAEVLAAALRGMLKLPGRPVLRPWTRLQVEQARQFVMELDAATAGVNPLAAMFTLGRMTEHCVALLDVLDAVVPA